MQNDRPMQDPRLQAAIQAIAELCRQEDLAGAFMLVSEQEAAYGYAVYTTWNAVIEDESTPLGFRIRLKTAEQGEERAQHLALGTGHMLAQLRDFGTQTQVWFDDLLRLLRKAGMRFQHRPFGGQKLPRLETLP